MTVTYVYCFSLLELSKSNKLIYDIIQYAYGYTFHKNIFFHNFLKNNAIFSQFSNKTTRFFHNFQKKRHDFFTIGLVPDPFTILEKKRWKRKTEKNKHAEMPDFVVLPHSSATHFKQ